MHGFSFNKFIERVTCVSALYGRQLLNWDKISNLLILKETSLKLKILILKSSI